MNPHMSTGNVRPNGRGASFPSAPIVEGDEGDRTLSHGSPSKPLLGVLPIARLIPQDIHSVMDYVSGMMAGSGALMAEEDDMRAKVASILLAASGAGVSLMTDYRLSLAKVIPIEAHEAIDHIWGMKAIALPFVLGYWKTSPKTAMTHVVTGVGVILSSLVTDYRSWKRRR